MLRLIATVLLLLNLGYYAWSHDGLRGWGYGPALQSEPERLRLQLNPQEVRVYGLDEAKRLEAQAEAPKARGTQCLMMGLFDSMEASAVREALGAALAPETWEMEVSSQPARWIVYMGRFETRELLARKKSELRQMNVATENLRNPALEMGLSLGGHDSAAAANAALTQLAQRGVRTARVMLERAEQRGQVLRLPAATDTLRQQIDGLKAEALRMALEGKTWQACPPAGAEQAVFVPQTAR